MKTSNSAYLNAVCANRLREQEVKRLYGFTERDNVKVYTLPKDQVGKKYGSRTYPSSSMKSMRLQQQVYSLRGQIIKAENEDLPHKEKARKLARLRGELKCARYKLGSELSSLPAQGAIVLEADA